MLGSIWEKNQFLLKVGMTAHCSSRYLFGGSGEVCASAYTKNTWVWSLEIKAGREGDHGWLDFLAVTFTSSPVFSLIHKREESLRKKLKYPIKALGATAKRSPVVHSAGSSFWLGLGKKQWDGWEERRAADQGRDSFPFWLILTLCSEY